jgi:hypothetical protein
MQIAAPRRSARPEWGALRNGIVIAPRDSNRSPQFASNPDYAGVGK